MVRGATADAGAAHRLAFAAPPRPATPPRRAVGARWSELAEKSILLTLLAVIVAEILPSVHLSALDIAVGVVAIVAADLAITTWGGRGVHFALLLPINFLLIYGGSRALSDRGNLSLATGLFFAYLTTLIVVLYDTYRPLREARDAESASCNRSWSARRMGAP